MDYGGVDKRRTKKDLKRKRRFRAYKRGGQFRSSEVSIGSEFRGEGKEKKRKIGKFK